MECFEVTIAFQVTDVILTESGKPAKKTLSLKYILCEI